MIKAYRLILALSVVIIATWTSVCRADPLRLLVPALAPWGYLDAEQKPAGIYLELAQMVLDRAGVSVAVSIEPIPRSIAALKDGECDLLVMLRDDVDLDGVADRVAKVMPLDTVVIPRKDLSLTKLEDLEGKTVAAIRGFSGYDQRFNNNNEIKKYPTKDYTMNLQLLQAGRVDATIGPLQGYLVRMKELGISPDTFGPPLTLNQSIVYLYYAKKNRNEEIAAKLIEAGKALETEKALEAALAKHWR